MFSRKTVIIIATEHYLSIGDVQCMLERDRSRARCGAVRRPSNKGCLHLADNHNSCRAAPPPPPPAPPLVRPFGVMFHKCDRSPTGRSSTDRSYPAVGRTMCRVRSRTDFTQRRCSFRIFAGYTVSVCRERRTVGRERGVSYDLCPLGVQCSRVDGNQARSPNRPRGLLRLPDPH